MSTLLLFDVDGTLTAPRQTITDEMAQFLAQVSQHFPLAIVGGSNIQKIRQQVPDLSCFKYVFAENGLDAYQTDEQGVLNNISRTSLIDYLGEDKLQVFMNVCLMYIASLQIPHKRGTFIELRNGMINVSPVGRGCSQAEREYFYHYDQQYGVRQAFIDYLRSHLPQEEWNLNYSIGGQISFDVFPKGWDKTYCLQFLDQMYPDIHFFGDKVQEGGNDYEIFHDPRVTGHQVTCPEDTRQHILHILQDQ